ncbi:hypothetical protein H1R20_g12186, partial [Candolleomyces eurysporus]
MHQPENTVITLSEWYHLQSPFITGVAANDATLSTDKDDTLVGCRFMRISVTSKANATDSESSPCLTILSTSSIDGHKLTIIKADGQNTQPYTVDSIQILADDRRSYLHPPANRVVFNETLLHPLDNSPAPGELYPGGADVNINLALDFDMEVWRFYINGVTFQPSTIPVLLQILSGVQAAQSLLPEGNVYSLPPNTSIKVSIPGGISSPARIGSLSLRINNDYVPRHSDSILSIFKSSGIDTLYSYLNPLRRDVVNTGDVGSNITVRFRTDNAESWILHCHIDWYLDLGLAIIPAKYTPDVLQVSPARSMYIFARI